MKITLNEIETEIAKFVGMYRHKKSVLMGLRDANGFSGDNGQIHISGASGEIAVAKMLGVYWGAGINTFHGADIGKKIQVRTRSKDNYDLIVRKNDNPADIYILVIDHSPQFNVIGWIKGEDARKSEYWKEYGGRPGAWFVPQGKLKTLENPESINLLMETNSIFLRATP